MNVGLLIGIVYALVWLGAVPIAWRFLDGREVDSFGEFTAFGIASMMAALFWPLGLAVGGPAWVAYRIYLRNRRRF